ncbi:GntR family transcriptional regulator [Mameliella alba]|nr:GntR family transcriptional regulator [Antarctobacter heliothermus]MBY6145804.1 GntR family transcriptional regulator [Mameliella alba]MBY6161126.1 GntR family transcriptional regulator [Mameliella alba]MBY6169596.1 GntR family transcriptional regulator [Mameliella alba]MBY6174615.1 GntR family transcriptional regulator [Mameliella alba]
MPAPKSKPVALGSFALETGRPASQQVHDHLRREIISGRLAPGTSLSEANLCNHFGVSRQPVREALLRLSTQSLVEIYPQRGSVVTRISVAMVRQAQLIREAVEVETLRRAIDRRTGDFLTELRNELTLQRAYVDVGDIARFFDSDQKFHRRICDQSGVTGIWESLQQSRSQLDRARHAELETVRSLPPLIAQHEAIVDAIDAGDKQRAETAMRQHLRRITDHLEETVAQAPELFDNDDPA